MERHVKRRVDEPLVVREDFLSLGPDRIVAFPFTHAVLQPFSEGFLSSVKDQLLMLNAGFKETDLFRVNQTGELANIDGLPVEEREKLWALVRLRNELYGQGFRNVIERITGCDKLNDRVDCAANVYSQGCHLLTHDDCISTRRISYILYVSDEPAWSPSDGGFLELYPQTVRGDTESATATPTVCIAPNFGTMVVFQVEGGTSIHSVQEVFTDKKRRISIQGWFHSDEKPLAPLNATIARLTCKVVASGGGGGGSGDNISTRGISMSLSDWIRPTYLNDNVRAIANAFSPLGSVSLKDFFRAEQALSPALAQQCDALDSLGSWRAPSYDAGLSQGWYVVGPPHRQRYCTVSASSGGGDSRTKLGQASKTLVRMQGFLCSREFVSWVETVCGVRVIDVSSMIRRFRPGLDYTVAQHRSGKRVHINWCLVNEATVWDNGSVGGYHVFTDADSDPEKARQEAEVYIADSEAGQVLSISPGTNILSIVLCKDETQVEFIRYVSCGAPGSRWDINVEMSYE